MMRHVKLLLVALLVAFSASSLAEAATPKKNVRHRTKHSTRVSAGAAASNSNAAGAQKKSTTRRKSAKRSTAKKSGGARKSTHKRQTTKPR